MMKKSGIIFIMQIFAVALIFIACQTANAQSNQSRLPRSMKGYELYSWQSRGSWHFSLVIGTNRLKKYAEVTSPKVRLNGIAALKKKLNELSRGEEVFWLAKRVPKMSRPPAKIVRELILYCEQRDIRLVEVR